MLVISGSGWFLERERMPIEPQVQCCDKEMEHKAVIKKWDSPILPVLLPK